MFPLQLGLHDCRLGIRLGFNRFGRGDGLVGFVLDHGLGARSQQQTEKNCHGSTEIYTFASKTNHLVQYSVQLSSITSLYGKVFVSYSNLPDWLVFSATLPQNFLFVFTYMPLCL